MKSDKAKEYLKLTAMSPDSPFAQEQDYVWHPASVVGAIKLAEQEAEERMMEKAIAAFDDMWFENGEDGEFEPDYEYHRKNFIQKLNEE